MRQAVEVFSQVPCLFDFDSFHAWHVVQLQLCKLNQVCEDAVLWSPWSLPQKRLPVALHIVQL